MVTFIAIRNSVLFFVLCVIVAMGYEYITGVNLSVAYWVSALFIRSLVLEFLLEREKRRD